MPEFDRKALEHCLAETTELMGSKMTLILVVDGNDIMCQSAVRSGLPPMTAISHKLIGEALVQYLLDLLCDLGGPNFEKGTT